MITAANRSRVSIRRKTPNSHDLPHIMINTLNRHDPGVHRHLTSFALTVCLEVTVLFHFDGSFKSIIGGRFTSTTV